MFSILLTLLVIVAVLMTGLILLQKSEGSGMSGSSAASMFGGVLTGSAAGNFLTKTTAWLATLFFILCAMLSLVVAKTNVANPEESGLHKQLNPQPIEKTTSTPETKSEPIDMDTLIDKVGKKSE
ncbi:MAG: preprotein translocase subunit SecG [Alphaproteobacteria bacterium]|nr:preprotein translocase subunit SecG [Alphaproteobacteria bacterium]